MDAERFWSRVRRGDGCWEWTGPRTADGYGKTGPFRTQWRAHRLAYVLSHGAIPGGLWVLHRCDNRACVRPDHLYAGTPSDNNRDTVRRKRRAPVKSECKRGHPFTPDNTWRAYARAGEPRNRRCAICTRELNRQSKARRRQREAQPV